VNFEVISFENKKEWEKRVKEFSEYDIYYTPTYLEAFYLHGDGNPLLFYYSDDDIKAINIVMKRDIVEDKNFRGQVSPNTYFDLETPYGYGGFLIEGKKDKKNIDNLKGEYDKYCREHGIVSEFVRFHPILCNASYLSEMYQQRKLGRTIVMDLSSREVIWNGIKRNRIGDIKKAKKNGVEIFWGRSPCLLAKFIEMYSKTMDKNDANKYYYFNKAFYDSILYDLKNSSLFFYAMFESRIISMAIILFCNGKMHYHLSTTDLNYQKLAPASILLYEAACWGSENGYETFHLGGGLGGNEDNLYKFKAGFNINSNVEFIIGRRIFDEKRYSELVKLRKRDYNFDENKEMFIEYRM